MTVPQDILDFLISREGYRKNVYFDTRGYLTAGLGHRLLPGEKTIYKYKSEVPEQVLQSWMQADTRKAYDAALAQAEELRVSDHEFIKVLTSINFQVGTEWTREFYRTWALLLNHEWEKAAEHIGHSLWAKQTKTRVEDFQKAILALVPLPVANQPVSA